MLSHYEIRCLLMFPLKKIAFCICGAACVVERDALLTSLCPQPGSGAAEPQSAEGHGGGEQTHSRVAACGVGEELSLGSVY